MQSFEMMMQDLPIKMAWFLAPREDLHSDPYPFLEQLLREDPFFFIPMRNMWIATRYEDVVQILRHPAFGVEPNDAVPADQVLQNLLPEAWKNNWLPSIDPPRHTRMRRLASQGFTPRRMERLKPLTRSIAERLIADMAKKPVADVIEDFANPLPLLVIAEFLGVPAKDHDKFLAWAHVISKLLDMSQLTPEYFQTLREVAVELSQYFLELLNERRVNPQEDMISDLIAARESGTGLTEEELISTCIEMIVVGHDTTTNLIGNAVYNFLKRPEVFEQLKARPELIPSSLEEVLRYEPVIQMMIRIVGEDVEFNGHQLKRGQFIGIMLSAANRDPEQFENPGEFDIERTPNRHLAFGAATHFCMGSQMGRMEASVAMSVLLEAFPNMRLTGEPLKWRENYMFRALKSLPVQL